MCLDSYHDVETSASNIKRIADGDRDNSSDQARDKISKFVAVFLHLINISQDFFIMQTSTAIHNL